MGVARINPDGSLDSSYTAGVGGNVSNMALQPDGKLLVSGMFSYANGYWARTGLVRFYPDGQIDRAFKPVFSDTYGWGADNGQVVPLPNGQIMISGLFFYVNYTVRNNYLARLNYDGSLDQEFQSNLAIPDAMQTHITQVAPIGDKYVVTGDGLVSLATT